MFSVLQSRPCLASPRPCSHLCLRNTIMKYQCGCPPNSDDLINGTFCSGEYWNPPLLFELYWNSMVLYPGSSCYMYSYICVYSSVMKLCMKTRRNSFIEVVKAPHYISSISYLIGPLFIRGEWTRCFSLKYRIIAEEWRLSSIIFNTRNATHHFPTWWYN